MEQFEFHNNLDSTRTWKTLEPGIEELVLNEDTSTSRRTTLQRWQPDTTNSPARVFTHDYVEEIYMAEGDLYDLTLEQGWEKGAYAYRKPGMDHGPFHSEGGCLMFIVCIPVEGGKEVKQE